MYPRISPKQVVQSVDEESAGEGASRNIDGDRRTAFPARPRLYDRDNPFAHGQIEFADHADFFGETDHLLCCGSDSGAFAKSGEGLEVMWRTRSEIDDGLENDLEFPLLYHATQSRHPAGGFVQHVVVAVLDLAQPKLAVPCLGERFHNMSHCAKRVFLVQAEGLQLDRGGRDVETLALRIDGGRRLLNGQRELLDIDR